MLIKNKRTVKLRLLVFFKRHPIMLLGLPYIFIHELAHFIFLRMSPFYKDVIFTVDIRSIGFEIKNDEYSVSGFFPILNLLIIPIAPLLFFILNYCLVPLKMEYIYMLTFGIYLIPSSADILTFFELITQVIKNKKVG